MTWRGPQTKHDLVLSRKLQRGLRRYWVAEVISNGLGCALWLCTGTDKALFKINGKVNDHYLVVGANRASCQCIR
jgi:hypothetical protein